MVTNMNHVGEGPVRLRFKSGLRLSVMVRLNDRVRKLFQVEREEGFFEVVPHSELAYVSIPINRR